MSVDFGDMKQNEIRQAQITVSNAGAGALVINEVEADCGCTVAEIQEKRLGPGQRTTLTVTFDSQKFHGLVRKMVHLYTNDPDRPKIDVVLSAKIAAYLIVDPNNRRLHFQNTRAGRTRTMEAVFRSPVVNPLQLSAKETEKGLFDVEVVNGVDGDPQTSKVVVTLPSDFPLGQHVDNLRVSTNIEQEPYVDLSLAAYVARTLVSFPERVNFRFKKNLKQTVRVHPFNRGEEPFKVTKLETDVPGLSAEITGGIPNREVVIELTGKAIPKTDPRAIAAEGKIKGTLFIHTDHPEVPVIEVPVSYMVRM